MPATFRDQQKAACAALAAKRGETDENVLKGASKDMFEWMTESELEELAHSFPLNSHAQSGTDHRQSAE